MRRRRGLLVFLVVGALLVGGVALQWLSSWSNQPSKQAISLPDAPADALNPELKPVDTAYYQTKIPKTYRTHTAQNPATPQLVQTVLFDSSGSGQQVGITSNRLGAEGLAGVGDYHFRATSPKAYQTYTHDSLPPGSKLFQKTDGSEITVFMTQGGRYASVTVSGKSTSLAQNEAVLRWVADNWQWKK